jgi:hypothetical protein
VHRVPGRDSAVSGKNVRLRAGGSPIRTQDTPQAIQAPESGHSFSWPDRLWLSELRPSYRRSALEQAHVAGTDRNDTWDQRRTIHPGGGSGEAELLRELSSKHR